MDLRNPATRWAIGLSSGLTIAAVAYLTLDGTVQTITYGFALGDAVLTPLVLKAAANP